MALRISRILTGMFIMLVVALAAGCAKPKVQVQVSRDKLQQGEDVRVNWTSKDAKQVTLNGQTVDKTGSKVFTPDNTTTYTAVATRGKKEARDSKVVAVTPRPPRPTITISVDQSAITRGQSTTLRWSSNNADRVSISELGTVTNSGTRVVSPSASTPYTATATGPGGTETASARLTVGDEPSTPTDTTRPRGNPVSPTILALFNQWVQPVYFDYDSAELLPDAKDRLRRAAQWLTQAPNRSIIFRIEGNCDPRGTAEYNLGLGDRRARAVRDFLVSLGVDPSRIETVSYGLEKATGTSEGSPEAPPSWAHDRRAEFVYLRGGEKP